MAEVVWKVIPSFPNYEASNLGEIRNVTTGKIMKQTKVASLDFRPTVKLTNGKKHVTNFVHRQVLEAFCGKCPEGMEGCHNDGDIFNNNITNLRWDTHLSNMKDKLDQGNQPYGEDHPRAILTNAQAREIRSLYPEFRVGQLAKKFNIDHRVVSRIVNNQSYIFA